jgi:UDP-glucose 4-epimerase
VEPTPCGFRRAQCCNCGYGRGLSVFKVVDVVKQVAGTDFPVRIAGRRPGDAAMIVASADPINAILGWVARYDNIETIVRQALDCERRLHNRPMG